jgi:acetylornithine deacetylase/succinyl-diaminopimelate desuccinylase-like protein
MTVHDLTVLDLLDTLVRIDSVNPGLDPAGAGETDIAVFIVEWARAAGLRTQVVEGTPGRPSVVLRGGGNVLAHLDPAGIDAAVVTQALPCLPAPEQVPVTVRSRYHLPLHHRP